MGVIMKLMPPMLAAAYKDGMQLVFPVLATPKIDGIRGLIADGKLVSRSGKKIPNIQVRVQLEGVLPEGADGEIQCGTFSETTSVVMSSNVSRNITYYWFDWAYDVNVPYQDRIDAAFKYFIMSIRHIKLQTVTIVPLIPKIIHDMYMLTEYETYLIDKGYEGVIVRAPNGIYKNGRSTLSEGYLIKIKQYADYEAVAVGVEELQHRTHDGNKISGNTLGAIVAQTANGTVFKIGTGYTAEERKLIWINKHNLIGRYIKYKCAKQYLVPHSAVFLGIRHQDDMS